MDGIKTYTGIAIFAAPLVASFFGYAPTADFNGDIPETITALVQLCGAALAFYGRLRARVPGWFAKV